MNSPTNGQVDEPRSVAGVGSENPKGIVSQLADARIAILVFALAFGGVFAYRSLTDTFFQPPSKSAATIQLPELLKNADAVNEFVSLTDFRLDDRKYLRKYKTGHKSVKHWMDVYVPLHPNRFFREQKYDCLLKLTLRIPTVGIDARKDQARNVAVAKSIYHQKELIGTLYTASRLHRSVFKEFPELRRGETLVLDYAKRQKNYYLLDSFLGIVSMLGFAAAFVSWACWVIVNPGLSEFSSEFSPAFGQSSQT